MFIYASAFDQDLGWCVDNDVYLDEAFSGTPCASTSCGIVRGRSEGGICVYSRAGSENGNSREWEFPGIPGNSRGTIFHSRGARLGKTGKTRQLQWTRQTRFVLWAGSGQAYAPGACPTVLSYPSTRQSHWKCLSGFGEAAPGPAPPGSPRLPGIPTGSGSSREFPGIPDP